jgi:hypothetical protein
MLAHTVTLTPLSLGERVARDGAFSSRRGPGEGSLEKLLASGCRKTEGQFKRQAVDHLRFAI